MNNNINDHSEIENQKAIALQKILSEIKGNNGTKNIESPLDRPRNNPELVEKAMVDLKTLLADKVNLEIPDRQGVTPLERAVKLDLPEVASLLLDHGAKIDLTSKNKLPLIISTANHGNARMFKILLDAGADLNVRTDMGMTVGDAAKYAQEKGVPEIAEILKAKRAQTPPPETSIYAESRIERKVEERPAPNLSSFFNHAKDDKRPDDPPKMQNPAISVNNPDNADVTIKDNGQVSIKGNGATVNVNTTGNKRTSKFTDGNNKYTILHDDGGNVFGNGATVVNVESIAHEAVGVSQNATINGNNKVSVQSHGDNSIIIDGVAYEGGGNIASATGSAIGRGATVINKPPKPKF